MLNLNCLAFEKVNENNNMPKIYVFTVSVHDVRIKGVSYRETRTAIQTPPHHSSIHHSPSWRYIHSSNLPNLLIVINTHVQVTNGCSTMEGRTEMFY